LVEDIATRITLDMWNADGSLMAFICPSMPDNMRRSLFPKLKGCFNGVRIFQDQTPASGKPHIAYFAFSGLIALNFLFSHLIHFHTSKSRGHHSKKRIK
jgi:hypothetical protein